MGEAMRPGTKTILQLAGLLAFSTLIAFAVNAVREESLPLVMPFPPEYQCPSRLSQAVGIGVEEALVRYKGEQALFVDARPKASFDKGRVEGALSVPYSLIDPVPADVLASLRKAGDIIVYCNSMQAERSRLMAGEISAAGLKAVSFLEGGFLEWVKAGGPYIGQKPAAYE